MASHTTAAAAASELARGQFPGAVARLARQWRRALDLQLQPLGLTEATWLALVHISRMGAAPRQKDLAAAIGLDNSSVVRLLDMLEAAGHIARQAGADRRAKTISLTDSGRRIGAHVERIAAEQRQRLLGDIPAGELAVALSVVQRISLALEPQPEPAAGQETGS